MKAVDVASRSPSSGSAPDENMFDLAFVFPYELYQTKSSRILMSDVTVLPKLFFVWTLKRRSSEAVDVGCPPWCRFRF